MGARQSIINLNPSPSVCSERRRLFYIVAMTALAVAAGSVTLRAQRDVRVPIPSYMPPDFPATVNAVIPTPQYLPAGYELWKINRHPADGFGGGKAEIEVQYKDPACWDRKMNCSLQIFVSPMTNRPFSGTTDRKPELLSLRVGNRTVEAQYFNSLEMGATPGSRALLNGRETRLETGNFNALVFPFDHFMIGIRSNRLTVVGRSELIKVAKSLAYTER
ncbi:MAG TPA: hypothetical protein VNM47_08770 [Terriglobia bacterium]|nr:hypothetical protein [Terriglobia bacterium]